MNSVRRTLLAWLVVGWVAATAVAASPTTNATARLQPARWLVVVDTSSAMEPRAQAMAGVIDELLSSGVNGQMRAGDELGLWTYNKKLFAGVAPMQIWEPAKSNLISSRSARFIAGQDYQGKARFETVIPELSNVVKGSRKLTILLFSDGSHDISGTPYDAAINAAYAERRAELAGTRMPLVTVLRAERGNYIGQSVSLAPWPVEPPPFLLEEEPKPAPAPKPAEPLKSIIIGTPRKPAAATNTLVISRGTNAAGPVAAVTPVPVTPVEPIPTVEPELPKPSTAPVSEPVPPAARTVEAPKVETAPPDTVELASPASPAPVVTPAADVASKSSGGQAFITRKWLLILGMACMWVAIVIAFMLARRSRRRQSASLITRSFDRNQR